MASDSQQPSAHVPVSHTPAPPSPRVRARWLGPREIAGRLLGALILSLFVYQIAGQIFLFFAVEIAAYYVGETTSATITETNVPGFFGVPGEDATEQIGARGVYRDRTGATHTLFIQRAQTLHQEVDVSYLPFLPGVAVERADYEQSAAGYVITFLASALLLYAYWPFILRELLHWRIKQDWKIKVISRKAPDVMPQRATYRI